MRFNEGIDIKIVYCDDTPSEYIDDVTMNDIYDILDSSSDICKIVDVSGSKKKVVWTDEYGFERAYESKKSLTEKMLQDICNSWVIGKVKGEFKGRDYCHEGNDYSLYNIGNIIENALRDNYIVEFDGDDKTKTVIFNLINKDGKNVGTLEIFPDERYSAENYEDGFNWEDLNMKEIIKDFEDTLGYKIEYLKNDKRFDYSDRFWYKESKKFVRKSIKESVKPEIQFMVNNIIDELIGEYSSKEWDALSANEKFDIVRTEYFSFGYKSKYLSEVRDLVIENMNHPFNVVFESKKSMKESFDDGDQLVIDVVDMLILDFGYDKKTVEKYFYKIHKLNDFDTISIDEYIKIKEEIEKALGYDDIF